ncbi:MAG: A/G-specific adenine glycosylase [Bacteroides sp.]|nr:A/G-specific adenine glycosylase [Roseburia sp.]MCM1346965.1 A/G-specific adenine glycosylase [Bacteroides sp.]MCM1421866.1 A/G-specific adenine glycosylase [Bacteroides sp.]
MDKSFAHTLLVWYGENHRHLPWRETRNPYLIWISEIILQQTRVAQGYDYFLRFIQRFPDVKTLAQAEEEDVLKCWQGLGYYSRARNLHVAARQVAQRGGFPETYQDIRSLKGVGDYTAAAIASFAFGLPHAVVDGNVYRVLARYFGITEPTDTAAGKKYFARLAQSLLPKGESGANYNQAIMDFGALQCVPHSPECAACPLVGNCVAFQDGKVHTLPVKSRSPRISVRYFHYIFIRVEDEIALFRRNGEDIWKGLYEPFLIETAAPCSLEGLLADGALPAFAKGEGVTWSVLQENMRHQLTHRTLICNFYRLDLRQKPDDGVLKDVCWVSQDSLSDYAFPRPITLLLERHGMI